MILLQNLHPPTEGVRHEQAETTAVMDGKRLGCGTLYVAETRLSWFDSVGMGFSLEYPSIGLHAISRDTSAYPQEHLYVMVNGKLDSEDETRENEAEMAEKDPDDEADDEGGSGCDDDDEGAITEIRFVPSDKAALESMFSAMCDCQALHPDPEDDDSDNDFEGEEYDVEEAEHGEGDISSFYTCEEGLSALTQEGQATLDRLEGMLAQSVAQQYHMAGVRTDETNGNFEDGMEVDAAGAAEAGQFEDADVDHCDPTEDCFKYPLMTKCCSQVLMLCYLLCHSLSLVTLDRITKTNKILKEQPPDVQTPQETSQGTQTNTKRKRRIVWSGRDPGPMDTNESVVRKSDPVASQFYNKTFTRERIFQAASEGDTSQLDGLLDYLIAHDKRLTSPEFSDEINGKTALLKALLNLKNGKNDTIEALLDIAEKTGDLEKLVNTSYTDPYYKGQTALHVAIERRSFDHVKLLVEKGADVQAKANGRFFQYGAGRGFYFGELPLSMAACTNQMDIVSFLMENPHRRADVTDKDSQGNTVLHALAIIADNTEDNTDAVTRMYDEILIQHNKSAKKSKVDLEAIENNQGLTPLKLTAKLGRIGLFKHMLQREFLDEETRPLSRKFTEWVYGPVHSSLYDTSSLDTNEVKSVLELLVFGSAIPNRPEMLQVEPLSSLLEHKWDRYAAKLFLMNFLVYVIYMLIFSSVALYRKGGEPPFPVTDTPLDYLRCTGELISVLGALYFFYKGVLNLTANPPNFKTLYIDGFSEILFFLQGAIFLIGAILYGCAQKEYIGPIVISLALGWINILHYSGGFKQLGIYNIMMQRMILGDLLRFLFVYSVFLFGFSAAILVLIEDPPAKQKQSNATITSDVRKPVFNNIGNTTLELFKITIGMGDLEFTNRIECKEVFYFLLILYVALTHILLLNMLIALMGHTVDRISRESEDIWKLQRALAILNMERALPGWLRCKLLSGVEKTLRFGGKQQEPRRFFRVEEMNWKKWQSDLCIVHQEDPGSHMRPELLESRERLGNLWNLHPLLGRLRGRNHMQLINTP